jgi:uncharacterized protein with ATP-grasp and redox domains
MFSANQSNSALESSILVLTAKVLEEAEPYFQAETEALETAKKNLHLVKEVDDYLKKRP